jgi:hypothetical protein
LNGVFNMRKISIVLTVLVTSFVMTLGGLVASPIASAGENDGSISATFASGSSVLTKAQKAAIKKALASGGTAVTYTVTGTAGKLPGVSDSKVQRLAKARAKAIKDYLVSLGVSKTSVTTQVKTTEIGLVPKSTGSKPTPAATPTPTAGTGSGSGSSSGGVISVAAIAGVTAPVTGATRVTTTTAGTGYTGTVTWSPSAGTTFASATTYTATITLTPTSGYTLAGVAANFFTVAGATSATNSANAGVITAAFPATAVALAYAIGDTGPGGGKVFYVNAVAFTCGPSLNLTCNFLEAAPTSGTSAWTDSAYQWWSLGNIALGGAAQGRSSIGTGYANTLAMVNALAGGDATAGKAGTIAQAYRGPNNLTDWYLPSTGELNQLCKWAHARPWVSDATVCAGGTLNLGTGDGLGAAGFVAFNYWSSTEFSAPYKWHQRWPGIQDAESPSTALRVRPIRAFGPPM